MSFILLVEQAAPETPSANQVILYAKSDGRMYIKDDAGTEVTLQAFVEAGSRTVWHQTAAPTGWTKDTTASLNDNALRVVTGTVTPAGTVAFSTVMGTARTTTSVAPGSTDAVAPGSTDAVAPGSTDAVAPGSTDGFTLTTTEIPSHTHREQAGAPAAGAQTANSGGLVDTGISFTVDSLDVNSLSDLNTQATGGGGSHVHTHATTHVHTHATTHAHTSNLNVLYQDVIIASKD